MFNWLFNKTKLQKFKSRFVHYNKYTFRAFKCKSDDQFREVFWECIDDTASANNKDKQDVSLEDIYRVLHRIRKKTPNLLRRITLKQLTTVKTTGNFISDFFGLIYGIAGVNIIPIVYVGLKKVFGKRVEYVFKIYLVSILAQEIYKPPVVDSNIANQIKASDSLGISQ